MKKRLMAGALSMAVFAMACSEADTTTAPAPSFHVAANHVHYTGQGWTNGVLNNEFCSDLANDGGTGQGVDIAAGYLLWILTANGATSATITLPDGDHAMIKVGGTFKYASAYWTPDLLTNVSAVYAGSARGNVVLTVSHGCRGQTQVLGFCSPGFWRNNDAAWNVFASFPAPSKDDLFSGTVQPFAISNVTALGTALSGKTLGNVLAAPPISTPIAGYNFGGGAAFNANLNPFNAVGAYLTTLIPLPPEAPGYPGFFTFDPAQVGTTDHFCPLNADGSYKPLPE
jgi:hypothetical protein